MKTRTRITLIAGIMLACLMAPLLSYAQVDFAQKYTRGKFLLQQKRFLDAQRELYVVVTRTTRGKRHFGAHYYLALAYYRLGMIRESITMLARAKGLIKRPVQKRSRERLLKQINALFGRIKIVPEVDPAEVGPLKLNVTTSTVFSHPQKKRTFRILSKRWKTKGINLTKTANQTVYLPKGEYGAFSIVLPLCLQYALLRNGGKIKSLTLGNTPITLTLKSQRSCSCPGGQKMVTVGIRRVCRCPEGSVWSQKSNRCEIPKAAPQKSWIGSNWPWVTALGVGAVAAGIIVPLTLMQADPNVQVKVSKPKVFVVK
jgi:hypothetical protein